MMNDLKLAFRLLLRRPGLAGTSIFCLALGIGAVTLVFGFVSSILLQPLPYPDPGRVTMIWNQFLLKDLPKVPSSGLEFEDHRSYDGPFDAIAGYIPWDYNLTGGGEPQRVSGCRASASLFPILGAQPAMGRFYSKEEEVDQARRVVLSHGLWKRHFASDPDIVGTALNLDEVPYEIVGVLREDFYFPMVDADLWVPFTPNPAIPRRLRGVRMIGELQEGTGLAAAQAQVDLLADRFQADYPDLYPEDAGWGIRLLPIREEMVGDVRARLWVVQFAVGLILLIACANVANLLLARGAERGREMALRSALGARSGVLVRQLLCESFLLAVPAGLLGLLLAFLGRRLLAAFGLGNLTHLVQTGLDWRVGGFALLIALATGILCGLLPALRVTRLNLVSSLKEGGRGQEDGGARPLLRNSLVVMEVGLALAVLIGTSLTVRSLQQMLKTDPGFRTEKLLTLRLDLSPTKYRGGGDRVTFYRQLRERLEGLPEVESVALVSNLPPEERLVGGVPKIEGHQERPGQSEGVVRYAMINPEYLETLDIPVLDGRAFTDLDDGAAGKVALIDQGLAKRYWPDRNPVGQRVALPGMEPPGTWRMVVGVVGQVRGAGLGTDVTEQLYVPYPQMPSRSLELAVATRTEPLAASAAVREAIRKLDPAQPVARVQSMKDRLRGSASDQRFNSFLFGLLGGVTLVLVGVGVYGVMAYSVRKRRQEIGLRMALGADPGRMLREVLRGATVLTLLGVGLGFLLWALASFAISTFFPGALDALTYGVGKADLPAYLLAVGALLLLALLATLRPARWATRVDPAVALRSE